MPYLRPDSAKGRFSPHSTSREQDRAGCKWHSPHPPALLWQPWEQREKAYTNLLLFQDASEDPLCYQICPMFLNGPNSSHLSRWDDLGPLVWWQWQRCYTLSPWFWCLKKIILPREHSTGAGANIQSLSLSMVTTRDAWHLCVEAFLKWKMALQSKWIRVQKISNLVESCQAYKLEAEYFSNKVK